MAKSNWLCTGPSVRIESYLWLESKSPLGLDVLK